MIDAYQKMIDAYQSLFHALRTWEDSLKIATLHDVARSAGVSYATVDRVVNDRGGVATKSVLRVRDAIEKLRYQRDETAANLARKRVYRFHFILPDAANDFFGALGTALEAHQAQSNLLRTRFHLSRIPAFSERAIIGALDAIDPTLTDCVCAVALDTPSVVDAVRRARARGIKIITMISDIAPAEREHYVGIDNLVAGKTAGRVIGLAHMRRRGRVLPIIGANRAQDHSQRLEGFRDILGKHFPMVELLDPIKSRDDAATVQRALTKAEAAHPDLTGVYNIGAGNDGLVEWVSQIPPDQRPVIVAHELLQNSRSALKAGRIDAVIDQKPHEAIGEAMRVMRHLVDGKAIADTSPTITPAIYLAENLPPEHDISNRILPE